MARHKLQRLARARGRAAAAGAWAGFQTLGACSPRAQRVQPGRLQPKRHDREGPAVAARRPRGNAAPAHAIHSGPTVMVAGEGAACARAASALGSAAGGEPRAVPVRAGSTAARAGAIQAARHRTAGEQPCAVAARTGAGAIQASSSPAAIPRGSERRQARAAAVSALAISAGDVTILAGAEPVCTSAGAGHARSVGISAAERRSALARHALAALAGIVGGRGRRRRNKGRRRGVHVAARRALGRLEVLKCVLPIQRSRSASAARLLCGS